MFVLVVVTTKKLLIYKVYMEAEPVILLSLEEIYHLTFNNHSINMPFDFK